MQAVTVPKQNVSAAAPIASQFLNTLISILWSYFILVCLPHRPATPPNDEMTCDRRAEQSTAPVYEMLKAFSSVVHSLDVLPMY